MLISIVVPIHNEAGHLGTLLPALVGDVEAAVDGSIELILVENGSTDDTATQAESACERLRTAGWKADVLHLADANYGLAMRTGFAEASGDWVVNFDIDYFSGPFVAGLATQSADIVIASKRAPGSRDERSRFRRAGTYVFNLVLRTALGSRVSDTHGIKAFRSAVLAEHLASVVSNEDLFDTELVLRAERAGAQIAEVPIVVVERRAARTPYVRRIPRTIAGVARLRRLL